MTLSSSNNPDEEAAGSSSHSASTASTEVLTLPLGTQGEVFLDSDDKHLVTLFQDAVQRPPGSVVMVNSDGGMVGNVVNVKVEGPTNFMIKNINGNEKDWYHSKVSNRSPARCREKLPEIYMPLGMILTVTLIVIMLIIGAIIHDDRSNESNYQDAFFVTRESWGSLKPKNLPTLIPPPVLAVIKHTATPRCFTHKQCASIVRQIQREHMKNLNQSDIIYNFLIGGNGKIYEGRGWGVQNGGRNDSIDIAFIGDFNKYTPSRQMVKLAQRILIQGDQYNGLDYTRYHVVNHNQTEPTDSPGENLFRIVTQWRHYASDVCYWDVPGGFVTDLNCP